MVRGVGGGQLFNGGHCLNIFVKGGQLLKQGDLSRDSYYFRNMSTLYKWFMFRRQGRQHDEARKEINLTAQQTFQISTSTALSKWASSLFYKFFSSSVPIGPSV